MSGLIGDKLQISYGVQKKTVLRLFNTLGFIIPMIAVIGLMFVKSHLKCLYEYVLFKEIILIKFLTLKLNSIFLWSNYSRIETNTIKYAEFFSF
jgi:hypothetical protein